MRSEEPEEQHVQETPAEELAVEDALSDLAEGDTTDATDAPAPPRGTTADPGRVDPIVPGEGKLD